MSAVRESLGINVRPMRRADIAQVEKIETESYPFPWTVGIFRDCLQTGYFCRVLDTADGLIGYAIATVGAGEAHILNFCIRPDWQGQRLGTRFLRRLIDEIRRREAKRIILEVRPSNDAAQRLYARAGFTKLGLRRGYYPAENGREDALVFGLTLDQQQPDLGSV